MEWTIRKQDHRRVGELASALGCSPVLAWVLMNRGIETPEAAAAFLNPSLEQLRPPELMADAAAAVERIIRAFDSGETVGVYGDYDVDGITGTALLYKFLSSLGIKTIPHLPDRINDGYGMKPKGIETLKAGGASLVISVDCGISDFAAIDRANQLGIDVIVVDHHQLAERLPSACAVVNPQRPDCAFHGQPLSGVGAAFYLLVALRARLRELGRIEDKNHNLLAYLDLVALGTVADVVPLVGLNRVLVRFGLEQINRGSRPGIAQLRRVSGLKAPVLDAEHLSFQLAPRINAAGRVGEVQKSLELLIVDNERQAGIVAEELERYNATRRHTEEQTAQEALRQLESRPELLDRNAIVVSGQGWHIGVIGIVASRLVEIFNRPAAVIGVHGGIGKGSLRSVPGVNIFSAIHRCEDLLEAYGGHPMAAGVTVKESNLPAFVEALDRAVAEVRDDSVGPPALEVDAEWPLARCDLALVDELARLKPYGAQNPEPCFCARGVKVLWARETRGNSFQIGLGEGTAQIKGFAFRLGAPPEPGSLIDVVYTPVRDDYNGQASWRAKVRDLKPL